MSTSATGRQPVSGQASQTSIVKVVFASLIGTAVEWYDFFLYGSAAALVFGTLFFPESDPVTATLLAFGTYALGFVARPLGGIVFGHFGDRVGRKKMLVVALMMMGMGFVGVVESPYAAIALLSLGGFAHQTLSVTVITMASDLFKRSEVATVAGMAGTCGNAGLLIFSLMIGGLVATVGYTPFFIGLGVLDLVGAAVLWTLVREPRAAAEVVEERASA